MVEDRSPNKDEVLQQHPADIADHLQRLPDVNATAILSSMPRSEAAEVLSEMELEKALQLIAYFSTAQLVGLLRELSPHSAVDLVAELDFGRRREVLESLPAEKAAAIQSLLRYAEDTAGGIMSDRFISLRAEDTIQESQRLLRAGEEARPEDVSYLYVTNEEQRLVGVVGLRDLVFSPLDRKVRDIMQNEVRFVRVDDDQENIARQFEHYHYLGLPVLDRQDRLVGVVKASDALQIAQAEATEDMQLMVGLSGEERALTPWHVSMARRLPWLYVNLATAFLAAGVVAFFEDTIARLTALAVILPIIAGQGGNAGMQTLTVIIRDMALGELSAGDGRRALFKELVLGLVHGLAVGPVVGLLCYLWSGSLLFGVVAGVAMVLNQLAAALFGVMIPFGLKWLKIDPALASSIMVTTVTDVAGFFFLLGLAALAMNYMNF